MSRESNQAFETREEAEAYIERRIQELKSMSKREAQKAIANDVYASCALLEHLADVGNLKGGGHHMRQKVAAFASDLMGERWKEK